MKRWIALLLACISLMTLTPVLAEEPTDELTKEIWISEKGATTLTLSADHTGVYTANGVDHAGEWSYAEENKTVIFSYEDFGKQTAEFQLGKSDGDARLRDKQASESFFQKTVTERKAREKEEAVRKAQEEAESRIYALKLGEEVKLDFISFTFKGLKVYRAIDEVFYKSERYQTEKGVKYLAIYADVSNPTDQPCYLYRIYSEVTIGEETYPLEVRVKQGDNSYSSSLDAGKSSTAFFFVKLPDSVADSFTEARFRFSFKKGFAYKESVFYDGDYFFQIDAGAEDAASARKGAARKVTYFSKKTKLPKPNSYDDVAIYLDGWERKGGKRYDIYSCWPRYSSDNIKTIHSNYMKALKKAGFTLKAGKMYFGKGYTISKGKTMVGFLYNPKNGNFGISVPK